MRKDSYIYKHYYMVNQETKLELPGDSYGFINLIKRYIREEKGIGAIISYKGPLEAAFFSLSGMSEMSPLQEVELKDYLIKYPSEINYWETYDKD